MSAHLLDRRQCALLVIDVQERLRGHIEGFDVIAGNIAVLVQAARRLGVPVMVTEQHAVQLGPTAIEIAPHLDERTIISKTAFSAVRADRFDLAGRTQVLVCGLEAHLCVNQTVYDLVARGLNVQLAADATGSRDDWQLQLGLARAQSSGAGITSCEAAVFELMEHGATDEFRSILPLLKRVRPHPIEAIRPILSPPPSRAPGTQRRRRTEVAPPRPAPNPTQPTEHSPVAPTKKGSGVETLTTIAHPTRPDTRFVVHINGERVQWYQVEDDRHTPLPTGHRCAGAAGRAGATDLAAGGADGSPTLNAG